MSAPTERIEETEPLLPQRFAVVRGPTWSFVFDGHVARVTAVLAGLCLVTVLLSMLVGDTDLSLRQVIGAIFGYGSEADQRTVVQWRLPRVLLGLLGGIALAVSGAIFQSLTRNPLGSPDIMGFSTGAYTGALIAMIVVNASAAVTTAGALLGGFATALVVYLLAYRRGVHGMRLIIVGISVSAMLNAVNSYLLITAGREEAVSAASWGAGSLNGADWADVWLMLISIAVLIPFTVVYSRPLRLLEMGDDSASALGVRVERSRLILLTLGVGYVSFITALAGPISFVALAAPQLARRITSSAGVSLLAAAAVGALLLLVSDVIARVVIAPGELAVGVVTSCLGGAYLLWLLVNQARAR